MPATTPTSTGPLKVGDRAYFRLKFNSELVPAAVIDSIEDDKGVPQKLNRPRSGCVHLRVELDPQRHFSSSEFGFRLDVPEATAEAPRALGTFVRERPQDEDAWFQALEYRRGVELDIRRRIARGEAALDGRQ